jgi:pyruvate/2-oxoglutarate dehydrogenase complex dihydrolipoamide acyltransferase (E2) component
MYSAHHAPRNPKKRYSAWPRGQGGQGKTGGTYAQAHSKEGRMPERTKLRGWRKIAAATWGEPGDPQIYGDVELDAGPLLRFLEQARASGARVTLTHLVGRAIAHALHEAPDLNVRIYRGKAIRRDTVDIFFIVSTEKGSELSGIKVANADEKSAVAIAEELRARAARIHSGDDAEFGKTKALFERASPRLLGRLLRVAAWVGNDRDLEVKAVGIPRQAFGSAMISSVGMFGIQHAYAPLSPYYRVPFLILVGEVGDKPVAVDGEVVIRPMLNLAATIDHRYLDGFHAARLARSVRAYAADPWAFEPPLDG